MQALLRVRVEIEIHSLNRPTARNWLWRNQWPETLDIFREVAKMYIHSVLSSAMEVMRAISAELGVNKAEILSRVDELFRNPRIVGYEATIPKTKNALVSGIGTHTGLLSQKTYLVSKLTFLLADSQTGSLQGLSKTGDWQVLSFLLLLNPSILSGQFQWSIYWL